MKRPDIEMEMEVSDYIDRLTADRDSLASRLAEAEGEKAHAETYLAVMTAECKESDDKLSLAENRIKRLRDALSEVEKMCLDSIVVCRRCGDEETLQDSDILYSVRKSLEADDQLSRGEGA